jgi:Predicted iron-dependent peroxidase
MHPSSDKIGSDMRKLLTLLATLPLLTGCASPGGVEISDYWVKSSEMSTLGGMTAVYGTPDVGLLWTAYQRNMTKQFISVQRRLDELDLLNEWTVPIGSAEFAIAGGITRGEIIAQALFS